MVDDKSRPCMTETVGMVDAVDICEVMTARQRPCDPRCLTQASHP